MNILETIKQFGLDKELKKALADPSMRDELFSMAGLHGEHRAKATQLFNEALGIKPSTQEQKVDQRPSMAKKLVAFGFPRDQAWMAAMYQCGDSFQDVAAWLGERYPDLRLSPKIIKTLLLGEIKQRILDVMGEDDPSAEPTKTTNTQNNGTSS